jgi:hypothetical protein
LNVEDCCDCEKEDADIEDVTIKGAYYVIIDNGYKIDGQRESLLH